MKCQGLVKNVSVIIVIDPTTSEVRGALRLPLVHHRCVYSKTMTEIRLYGIHRDQEEIHRPNFCGLAHSDLRVEHGKE